MAIKTVSQLNEFDNGAAPSTSVGQDGTIGIGGNLRFFQDNLLTNRDKEIAKAVGDIYTTYSNHDYSLGTFFPDADKPVANTDTYWNSLFELSKPNSPATANVQSYNSYNIEYEGLLKNILWDVKSFLNWHNNLNDYNLSTIVDGNQVFNGSKNIRGMLSIDGNERINGDLDLTGRAYISGLAQLNAGLSVNDGLSVIGDQIINGKILISGDGNYLCGYASGLCYDDNGNPITLDSDLSSALSTYPVRMIRDNPDGTEDASMYTGQKYSLPYLLNLHDIYDSSGAKGAHIPVYFDNGKPISTLCVPNAARMCVALCGLIAGKSEPVPVWHLADTLSQAIRVTSAYGHVPSQGVTIYNWPMIAISCYDKNLITGEEEDFWNNGFVTRFIDGVPYPQNTIAFAYYAKHAFWSDLGEKYLADKEYEPGTLVKFGGEKEITIADDEANAIVSTHAFDLNACLKGGTTICLCGRVPTKVTGKISKFDKIMLSDTPGVACKWDGSRRAIGRALESNGDDGIKLVECVSQFSV